MRLTRTVGAVVFASFCGLATTSSAKDGAADAPSRITDPQWLVAHGFPPDARNVYAFADQLNQPLRATEEPSDYYGTTASGFSSYTGQAFEARNRSNGLFSTCDGLEDLYHVSGDTSARVQLDVPNGARLQAIRWWARDAEPIMDLSFTVGEICMPSQGAGQPTVTILATQTTLGGGGYQSGEMTLSRTVDMKSCTYLVLAAFGASNCNLDLFKIRVQWVRQVSPAPSTARFLDVPTNHPFFRFVEALASSGITGGCSANQFCPDSPVTRGQMAVFLATALGLNWGGL